MPKVSTNFISTILALCLRAIAIAPLEVAAFADWLVEEAKAAGNVKYDAPVMVVLGNPPYSGHSANKGLWKTRIARCRLTPWLGRAGPANKEKERGAIRRRLEPLVRL